MCSAALVAASPASTQPSSAAISAGAATRSSAVIQCTLTVRSCHIAPASGPLRSGHLAQLEQVPVGVAEEATGLASVHDGRREERGAAGPQRLVRAAAVRDPDR